MPYTPHDTYQHISTHSSSAQIAEKTTEQITYPYCAQTGNDSQASQIVYTFFKFLKFHHQETNPVRRIKKSLAETAMALDYSQDYTAKILVDMGLKAPLNAFPTSYINHLKTHAAYNPWSAGALSYAENKIVKAWHLA